MRECTGPDSGALLVAGTWTAFAKGCYFFVRPKRQVLELCIFLDRGLEAPQVRRAEPSSRTKVANLVHVAHRDEVEPPITDWMREAYESSDRLSGRSGKTTTVAKREKKRKPKASAK